MMFTMTMPITTTLLILMSGSTTAVSGEYDGKWMRHSKAYADLLLEKGRDVYGANHSPLIGSMFERKKSTGGLALFPNPVATLADLEDDGVRFEDRSWNSCNPMLDGELYEMLDLLSAATGDSKYAAAGDEVLKWFLKNTQSPATGLYPWGEHMGWQFDTDAVMIQYLRDRTNRNKYATYMHEVQPWNHWEKAFDLAPAQMATFAMGLWDHQVFDKKTGNFSRHTKYDRHKPEADYQFPRYGGHMCRVWANAYSRSSSSSFKTTMLEAIDVIAESYMNRRIASNRALPAGTWEKDNPLWWLTNNLLMSLEFHRAAQMLPEGSLKNRLLLCAATTDTVITQKIAHDLDFGGKGYLIKTFAKTLQPEKGDASYASFWDGEDYGSPSMAAVALDMIVRYRQLGSTPMGIAYRNLAIKGAEWYMLSPPDLSVDLKPLSLAFPIRLLLEVWDITGKRAYLDRAEWFAVEAEKLFLDDNSALPKVTKEHDWYETITGGDDLMLAFMQLHQALDEAPVLVPDTEQDKDTKHE